jgi:hypothetical protein
MKEHASADTAANARNAIQNLWDRALPVTPLLATVRSGVLDEAIEAARGEYLSDDTGTPEDAAYNQAVSDVVAAIGALAEDDAASMTEAAPSPCHCGLGTVTDCTTKSWGCAVERAFEYAVSVPRREGVISASGRAEAVETAAHIQQRRPGSYVVRRSISYGAWTDAT